MKKCVTTFVLLLACALSLNAFCEEKLDELGFQENINNLTVHLVRVRVHLEEMFSDAKYDKLPMDFNKENSDSYSNFVKEYGRAYICLCRTMDLYIHATLGKNIPKLVRENMDNYDLGLDETYHPIDNLDSIGTAYSLVVGDEYNDYFNSLIPLIITFNETKDSSVAKKLLKKINSKNEPLFVELKYLSKVIENEEKSVKRLKRQIKKQPDNAIAMLELGKKYLYFYNADKAFTVLEKAFELLPEDGDIQYWYGRAYILDYKINKMSKECEEGESLIRLALKNSDLTENRQDIRFYYATLLYRHERYSEAIEQFEAILYENPCHQYAVEHLNNCYEKVGDNIEKIDIINSSFQDCESIYFPQYPCNYFYDLYGRDEVYKLNPSLLKIPHQLPSAFDY